MRGLIETAWHAAAVLGGMRTGGIASEMGSGPSSTAGVSIAQFGLVAAFSAEADSLKQRLGAGNIAT